MSLTGSSLPSLERIMAVNHHLRLALDQVSDAVIVVENGPLTAPGPKILYANEAMARETGVPVSALCDVPLTALSGEETLLHALTSAAEVSETTAPLNRLQGTARSCRWRIVKVQDSSGNALNYILTAAPEPAAGGGPAPEPAAEKPAALRDQPPPRPEEYQQDLVETIRDTARYVAHEFNNALTAILLPVQVAIRQVPDGGDLHGKLQVAYESARRAADLAKDFLDCFRPRRAARERCRLDGLLGRAMRLATCAQNVNWTLEVADDLLEAEVDPNQIERVIFNLVRNASQAMPGGGKLLVKASNTAVTATGGHALTPGNYIHISVRDWGPGIPEEHMPHLFNSCFTTKDDGNGCGLPICYQIVRDHGGDMYVKSRPNVGTAFLIFLPAAEPAEPSAVPARTGTRTAAVPAGGIKKATTAVPSPAFLPPLTSSRTDSVPQPETAPVPVSEKSPATASPAPAAPESRDSAAGGPAAAALRVPTAPVPVASLTPPAGAETAPSMLVVDDEDGVRRALLQIGKVYGFEVITAATSEEGLQSYRDRLHARRRYDTVLLDLNLRGGLNGVEVFEALRRIDPEATVIATSGQYSEGDLERFQEIGFAGFLPKPFTLEDFDQVVHEVLAPQ